jgi:hypothetical protein
VARPAVSKAASAPDPAQVEDVPDLVGGDPGGELVAARESLGLDRPREGQRPVVVAGAKPGQPGLVADRQLAGARRPGGGVLDALAGRIQIGDLIGAVDDGVDRLLDQHIDARRGPPPQVVETRDAGGDIGDRRLAALAGATHVEAHRAPVRDVAVGVAAVRSAVEVA